MTITALIDKLRITKEETMFTEGHTCVEQALNSKRWEVVSESKEEVRLRDGEAILSFHCTCQATTHANESCPLHGDEQKKPIWQIRAASALPPHVTANLEFYGDKVTGRISGTELTIHREHTPEKLDIVIIDFGPRLSLKEFISSLHPGSSSHQLVKID
ncbi:MAG: hypothetical protein V1763_01005 [Parcubacteria group bacterium]